MTFKSFWLTIAKENYKPIAVTEHWMIITYTRYGSTYSVSHYPNGKPFCECDGLEKVLAFKLVASGATFKCEECQFSWSTHKRTQR